MTPPIEELSGERATNMLRTLLGTCFIALTVLPLDFGTIVQAQERTTLRVLVFTKTAGYRHKSIEVGFALIRSLGTENGFDVDSTEVAGAFNIANLSRYQAVVWLNTTGDVLNESQQAAFERYIRSGGGYVGVHAAADTEAGWAWYGDLLGGGAWISSHPKIQTARLEVEDGRHPSTRHIPPRFQMNEEWYNFKSNPRSSVNVLISIDERSYDPGLDAMGDHPISWSHVYDGGRAWYTNIGHSVATYANADFKQHLLGGILWVAGAAGM